MVSQWTEVGTPTIPFPDQVLRIRFRYVYLSFDSVMLSVGRGHKRVRSRAGYRMGTGLQRSVIATVTVPTDRLRFRLATFPASGAQDSGQRSVNVEGRFSVG